MLLVFCVMLALPLSAFAAPAGNGLVIQHRYSYIDLISAGLSINGSGCASCGGVVQATYTNTTASIEVSLQQYKNNAWTTLKTWTGSGPGYWSLEVSGDYYVSSGYSYRVVSTATVYNASGSKLETANKTTSEKTY
jgi:hypothetical protein